MSKMKPVGTENFMRRVERANAGTAHEKLVRFRKRLAALKRHWNCYNRVVNARREVNKCTTPT